MHPAWLLATKSASERRSRTILLVLAVTLSASLITAVTLGLHSVNKALEARVARTARSGDLRIQRIGGKDTFNREIESKVQSWPEVASTGPRLQTQLILEIVRPVWVPQKSLPNQQANQPPPPGPYNRKFRRINSSLTAIGVTEAEKKLRPLEFVEGRWPQAENEIVVDELVVRQLGARGRVNVDAKEPIWQQQAQSGTNESDANDPTDTKIDFGPKTIETADAAVETNEKFNVHVGSTLFAVRQLGDSIPNLSKVTDLLGFKRPTVAATKLTVVGIAKQPVFGGRAEAYLPLETLQKLTDDGGKITELDIVLKSDTNADKTVAAHAAEMPPTLTLQTTEKITGSISKNLAANRLTFTVGSLFAYLGAAFIIMTAMSTAVTERQRELAMLRCIGASKYQLAQIQLLQGLQIGGIGALLGVPLGIAMAEALFWYYKSDIRIPLTVAPIRVAISFSGALLAGLIGSAIPAFQSARVAPLKALAIRAKLPSRKNLLWVLAIAVFGIAANIIVARVSHDADHAFWLYLTIGIPGLLIGYFLICVPIILALSKIFAQTISRLVGLPPILLERTIRATPYRFGFSAGAMMVGVALMIALWTQGRGIMDDYITRFKFPDVFVLSGDFKPGAQQKLDSMKNIVTGTNAISMVAMESNQSFGVQGMSTFKTTFIGFEPDRFFELAKLDFVEGDEATAKRRLKEGGAIIVAKEFKTAKKLGVGNKITMVYQGRTAEFEIVGVVTSPGLDLISKFFQIGNEYVDQAINSVFGSREDLKSRLLAGVEPPTQLINVSIGEKVDERYAIDKIRLETIPFGAIQVGSGRRILRDMTEFLERGMRVGSAVAVLAMIVASFGVANVIVAGINARQFEFGVLRAVGAPRVLLTKLVLGEAILVGVTASIAGMLMGFQAVMVGRHIDEMLFGITLTSKPPLTPTLLACWFVILVAICAAAPAAISLAKKGPRELLGSIRG